jgi:thioredoxin 2
MSEPRHIVCPDCHATNRVPPGRSGSNAKCGKCHKPLFAGQPVAVTARNFMKQISANDIPVVVDFWAAWCGPCKMMAPVFARAAAELEPEMRFLKVDTEAEQSLAAQYGIRSIPTLMVFRKGKVIAQQAGALDATRMRAWLQQYVQPGSRS